MKLRDILVLGMVIITPMTVANADDLVDVPSSDDVIESPDFIPADQLLSREPDNTECATAALADALARNASAVNEQSPEYEIEQWIQETFAAQDVLRAVLACPEIANIDETDSVKFLPVKYTFPGGREIVINYETQPKVLKQRLSLATKRALPTTDPNPAVGPADDAIWTNTNPAWYGIIAVEHGALSQFVGEDKNNTISLKYINDHISNIYPHGFHCTSKSALALDSDELNQVVHTSVRLDDDSNDYYVAGDVDLSWISYAEMALDVAITVATAGGGAVVLGATKASRASRALHGLTATIKNLRNIESVQKYIRISNRASKATNEIAKLNKAIKTEKNAAEIAKMEEQVRKYSDELKDISKTMKEMERSDKDVKKFKEATDSFKELNKYRRNLRALRPAQRGNIIARAFRAFRAANTGNKTIKRGAKIARSSMKSGKVRDWLFHSTRANIGKLAKLEEAGGLLYSAIKFAGDMYDYTESSTGNFTNGVDFKPLLLLSADDLKGQENVVNYGMWLMWAGDSTSPADDDAAFLQAMDFAEKVWQDFVSFQQDHNRHDCNIDMYVVRPIIRNPDSDNAELYYLIMNDTPWTTAEN